MKLTPEQLQARRKKNKKLWLVAIGLWLMAGCLYAIIPDYDTPRTATYSAPKPTKSKWELWQEQYVSGWDGSCRPVEQLIKKNLNDPKSYEHSETRYYLNADTTKVNVLTAFRAKNGFGGLVLTTYSAEVDMAGNVLTIEEVNL